MTLNGSYEVTDALSVQANAYRREFHQSVVNGNRTEYTACTSGNGLLCQPDGATPLIDTNGAPIPDISQGGTIPIGENDLETIHAVGLGGTLQTTYTGKLFDHENNFVFGGSIDHSNVDFQSSDGTRRDQFLCCRCSRPVFSSTRPRTPGSTRRRSA